MNALRFVVFCITYWCFDQIAEIHSENALIFDNKDRKLTEMRTNTAKCPHCITVCPASSKSEQECKINEYASITGNGVFLQEVYENLQYNNMEIDICNKRPIPAIVWNKSSQLYEIGYELFYEEGKLDLKCQDYKEFNRIIDGKPDDIPKHPPNNKMMQSYNYKGNFIFQIINKESNDTPKSKFVFFWINVLSISDLNSEQRRLIKFTKDQINNNYIKHASNISRSKNYYFGDHRDTTLIEENRKIFARLATCTYLNMAFIWNTIANMILKKVDLYLYALYRLWSSEITITFGVKGISDEISSEELKKIEPNDDLFNHFPVPEIIFRIVEYRLENEIYDAVVVIHNNITSAKPKKRICATQIPGWEDIGNTEDTPGFTYICRLTKRVHMKLAIDVSTSISKTKALRLDKFPYVSDEKGTVSYNDVTRIVRKEFNAIRNPHRSAKHFNSDDVSKMIRRLELRQKNTNYSNISN